MAAASPREAAVQILAGLFASPLPGEPGGRADGSGAFSLVDFQEEAVERLRGILSRRGGAVLADSVGLGKTYVCLALVQETLRGGGDALIIVPASLRGVWRGVLRRVGSGGGDWRLLSHTQLARGGGAAGPVGLIVVDEAHRFRNPRTLRHAALARLAAQRTHLLLVTATPVNNRADDLLHLLRLFAPDDAFADIGVASLREAFGAAAPSGADRPESNGTDPAQIAAVVRSVVVRRTRAMVKRRFGESALEGHGDGPRFPARAPPRLVRYRDASLPRLVAGLSELELAPYDLRRFQTDAPASEPGAASALIRLSLLKRLDSSPAALQSSLGRLMQLLRATLEAALAGRVMTPDRRHGGGDGADADPLQLDLIGLIAKPAPPGFDLEGLVGSLRRDRDTVREMVRRRGTARWLDPKLRALRQLLGETKDQKVVVFTEFRDTAEALWRDLAGEFRVARVDGSGAWLGRQRAGRRLVVEHFAPLSNHRPVPPDRARVDVLIATDVLAEGLNLQDARHVVSYDLPWNPVRLLQRIGRVDRLGSLHNEVVPYLFAPAEGLECILGLTRRLRTKLGHISAVIGAEQAEELLQRLAHGSGGAALDRSLERADAATEDPVERLRTLWIAVREEATTERCTTQAKVRIPAGHAASTLEWVVLISGTVEHVLLEVSRNGRVSAAGHAAAAAIGAALDQRRPSRCRGTADLPWEAVMQRAAEVGARARAPSRLPRQNAGRRLARRIRRMMADTGAALDPRLIARADLLLSRLASPLAPHREAKARRLLGRAPKHGLADLLEQTERLLGDEHPSSGGGRSQAAATLRILAALRIESVGEPATRPPARGSKASRTG